MQIQEKERRGKRMGEGTEEEQEKEEEWEGGANTGREQGGRGSTSGPAMGGFNPACFDAHN